MRQLWGLRAKRTVCVCAVLVCCALPPWCFAQEPAPALDGSQAIFHDPLLDKMAGKWNMSGTIRGRKVEHTVEAEWVLNHQFLRVHEKGVADSKSPGLAYEAIVMIGYDNTSERYVAHWMDIYGGRFSETLGYGVRSGDETNFVFEYPDGPFHTTFRWLPAKSQWQWLMRTKNASGQWTDFSDLTLTRAEMVKP